MATYTVTTNADELDNIDGLGTVSIANFGGINDLSLREALALADIDPTTLDTIDFDANVFTGGLASLIRLDTRLSVGAWAGADRGRARAIFCVRRIHGGAPDLGRAVVLFGGAPRGG